MKKNQVKIYVPATTSNLSCGFDVLGIAIEGIGDVMTVRMIPDNKLTITKISNQNLPTDIHKNVAGVAGLAFMKKVNCKVGFEIEIEKNIKPGSGIGSSAASSCGAVWAMNYLLGNPLTTKQLIPLAMEGEKLASGSYHADNVAPTLLGGIAFVKSYEPLDILSLPVPDDLVLTIVHPQIEVKTKEARAILPSKIELKNAVKQSANLGGFVSGLYTNDYNLISRSLTDFIVEPYRSQLIPGFKEAQEAAIHAGALGCGISGSGPSIYALSKGNDTAIKVGQLFDQVYKTLQIEANVYVSKVNKKGIKIIE
ncbi:MAG: homoserine kinase [Lutibacter sp.]